MHRNAMLTSSGTPSPRGQVRVQGGAVHAALTADPGSDGEFTGGEFAGFHADHDG
jgi:hypothetical protein